LRAAEIEKLTKLRMPDNPAAITRYISDIDNTVASLVDLGYPIQPQELMLHVVKSIDNLKDRSQQILRDQS
jgi:lipoate-protein ligase A